MTPASHFRETAPSRLLFAARKAAMRFTDPGRHAALTALRETARLASLPAAASRLVPGSGARVYTALQRVLKGRTTLPHGGPLPAAAETFEAVKAALLTLRGCRGAWKTDFYRLFAGTASAVRCLELALAAPTRDGAERKGAAARERLRELRAAARDLRTEALCHGKDHETAALATTAEAFEKFLEAIQRAVYVAVQDRKRR